MIKCGFEWLIGFFLTLFIGIFFYFWVKNGRDFYSGRHLPVTTIGHRCPICLYDYFLSRDVDLSRCPFCGSLNRKSESLLADLSGSQIDRFYE